MPGDGYDEAVTENEVAVDDEATRDEEVADVRYDIASYGWDADVEGLVRRLDREEILVPEFQRNYVWRLPEASRFIESLLFGLPVPGIFLAEEPETSKQLVIDGQQRLKTLQFYYAGLFNPKPHEKRHRVFALQKVLKPFEGKTYEQLDERDRRRLDNSIIPATIVRQLAPADDDTSVYHIFERLNSGGKRLTEQEIRVAIYHGPLINALREINDYESWRQIFGKISPRLKDQELILRFWALYYQGSDYSRPMSEFLNQFSGRHKNAGPEFLEEARRLFENVVDVVRDAIGDRAFRPERALNAAVYDSVMVGLARRLQGSDQPNSRAVAAAYKRLLKDSDYMVRVSRSTADESFLQARLEQATAAFEGT